MKKQTSLLAVLLLCLATTAWAASSIVSVSVGSADANPSLIFGQDAEKKQVAAPPFSGMFGVKDIYLANTANIGGELTVTGDYERLGTDIRASVADEDYWVLMAGSDAKLYFGIANEGVTPEYEVVYEGANEPVREAIADGSSLSVKAGGIYKFYQKGTAEQNPVSRSEIKATQFTVVLTKDENEESSTKGLYVGYGESEDGSKTTSTFYAEVVTTDAPVYVAVARVGEGEVYDYYKSGDEGAVKITKDETADGWLLTCRYPKSTQMTVNYVGSRITLTVPTGDGNNDPMVGFEATTVKGSFQPITTTFYNSDDTKIVTINWTIKMAGTLDFDQDTFVDINDAMFLLNFQEAGCPDESDPFFTADQLAASTEVSEEVRLTTALESLRNMGEALDFDEDGFIDINDAMYLLNYQEAGCPDASDPFFTADQLAASTEVTDQARLEKALENLRNYTPAQ